MSDPAEATRNRQPANIIDAANRARRILSGKVEESNWGSEQSDHESRRHEGFGKRGSVEVAGYNQQGEGCQPASINPAGYSASCPSEASGERSPPLRCLFAGVLEKSFDDLDVVNRRNAAFEPIPVARPPTMAAICFRSKT